MSGKLIVNAEVDHRQWKMHKSLLASSLLASMNYFNDWMELRPARPFTMTKRSRSVTKLMNLMRAVEFVFGVLVGIGSMVVLFLDGVVVGVGSMVV